MSHVNLRPGQRSRRDPQRTGDFVLLFGDLFAQFVELFHVLAHGLRV